MTAGDRGRDGGMAEGPRSRVAGGRGVCEGRCSGRLGTLSGSRRGGTYDAHEGAAGRSEQWWAGPSLRYGGDCRSGQARRVDSPVLCGCVGVPRPVA